MEHSRAWRESRWWLRKLASTMRILIRLGMARTFGKYVHSIWDGKIDYAVYRWRGHEWAIPTSYIDAR